MALTTCDDCGRPVSDHAAWCPGCGRSDGRTILEIVRRLGALEETTLRLELRLDQIQAPPGADPERKGMAPPMRGRRMGFQSRIVDASAPGGDRP